MANNIELLAPAGNYDSFIAAVENGADAVYLGGKLLNARQFAGNFDNEQLKKALDYAHVRDVKIYLTMNTLVSDSELKDAVNFIGEAYLLGIDGIIVQDIGLASIVRELFPDLELHASTQMTVYNLEGVETLKKLGFSRVVLARELHINEIERIAKNTGLEIEIFIHGALCVSYSGQCLMSSMIGGRSGNRGKCAQPCRLPYELVSGNGGSSNTNLKGYLMSPKDLCSIEDIQKIIQTGVKSLKIEGRMKAPEYVATVVRIYRKYIDSALESLSTGNRQVVIDRMDRNDLTQIFNRGGLSKGYLFGKQGKGMMSYEKPKNWGIHIGEVISYDKAANTAKVKLSDKLAIGDGIEVWNGQDESPGTIVTSIKINGRNVSEITGNNIVVIGNIKGKIFNGNKIYRTSEKRLNEYAKEALSGKFLKRIPVAGNIKIIPDNPIVLNVQDNKGNAVEAVSEVIPEIALNKAISGERIIEQLKKTGSTPFDFTKIEVKLGENLSVPISELNNLRRKALEELELKRKACYTRQNPDKEGINKGNRLFDPDISDTQAAISLFLYNFNKRFNYSNLDVQRVYIPFNIFVENSYKEVIANLKQSGKEVFTWLPAITKGRYDVMIKEKLEEAAESGIDGFLLGNLGVFEQSGKYKHLVRLTDYTLNIFNSLTVKELGEMGIDGVTLSPELTLQQISNVMQCPGVKREAIVYGRLPLMTSEYCPVGSLVGGMTLEKRCNSACTKSDYKLKDRLGIEFPVMCDRIDCRSTVFNSNVLLVADQIDKIVESGVDWLRLNIIDESFEGMRDVVVLHRAILEKGQKAVEQNTHLLEKIKRKGFTKGHYFRGV